MKKLLLVLAVAISGCNSINRLTGVDTKDSQSPAQQSNEIVQVACCPIPNTSTYPSFLPADQVALCERVKANNRAGQLTDGKQYIAMSVGCGYGHGYIGDQYYPEPYN